MQLRWANFAAYPALCGETVIGLLRTVRPVGPTGDVSPCRKTVEYRLHKVLTKLGITGRLELVKLDLG
jgi:hypothetical protein